MKKQPVTLHLHKETVRALDTREARAAAAAVGSGRYTFCGLCSTACG
jgi:hypothetical protein